MARMAVNNSLFFRTDKANIKHNTKVLRYPDGSYDLLCSTSADFGPEGWETAGLHSKPGKRSRKERQTADPQGEDLERSMRRARAKVRRLALANDFRWFVTLTLDQQQIDRYDMAAVTRKLNAWLSNLVQRHGLSYVLVPEHHKDGAIHFHGFMSDCPALQAVEAVGHKDKGGHQVYNLARWALGFSTAIELYGDYHAAVAYVCKYIGKQPEKIGGRWYYSGGLLRQPVEEYFDLDFRDVLGTYGDRGFQVEVPGRTMVVVNGIREGNTPCE